MFIGLCLVSEWVHEMVLNRIPISRGPGDFHWRICEFHVSALPPVIRVQRKRSRFVMTAFEWNVVSRISQIAGAYPKIVAHNSSRQALTTTNHVQERKKQNTATVPFEEIRWSVKPINRLYQIHSTGDKYGTSGKDQKIQINPNRPFFNSPRPLCSISATKNGRRRYAIGMRLIETPVECVTLCVITCNRHPPLYSSQSTLRR